MAGDDPRSQLFCPICGDPVGMMGDGCTDNRAKVAAHEAQKDAKVNKFMESILDEARTCFQSQRCTRCDYRPGTLLLIVEWELHLIKHFIREML